MEDLIHRLDGGDPDLVFELKWRVPYEKENLISVQYIRDYIQEIIGCDCWAMGTTTNTFFSFYDLENGSESLKEQRYIRDHVILEDNETLEMCMHSPQKMYIVLGGNPFRYITLEYTSSGLGILSDYQRPDS